MKQDHSQFTDEALARMAQAGDRAAFETLCDRCLPVVYKRLRALLPPEAVEDVTQEVFIAALGSLENYAGKSLFRTWLGAIARHKAMDFYRRRGRQPETVSLEASEDVLGSDGDQDDRMTVRLALQRLPTNYQEILLLRFADGLPFERAAATLSITLEACKSRYRRAIAALEQEMRCVVGNLP